MLAAAGCGGSSRPGAQRDSLRLYDACKLYSPKLIKQQGGLQACSDSFVYTAGLGMLLGGTGDNIYGTVSVKRGSYKELANGDAQASFLFKKSALDPTDPGGEIDGGTATLHKFTDGWRITKIA